MNKAAGITGAILIAGGLAIGSLTACGGGGGSAPAPTATVASSPHCNVEFTHGPGFGPSKWMRVCAPPTPLPTPLPAGFTIQTADGRVYVCSTHPVMCTGNR